MEKFYTNTVIIGAGVVGLAIAKEISTKNNEVITVYTHYQAWYNATNIQGYENDSSAVFHGISSNRRAKENPHWSEFF